MNVLTLISLKIIKKSFNLSVWFIEQHSNLNTLENVVNKLRLLPFGTIGNEIAKCLDENNLKLISGYESHDLKHVVLDYKMTALDEIRMQAFMLGNGNCTLPCFSILLFGLILLPSKWQLFFKDFKKGKASIPISSWTIDEYAHMQIADLRYMVLNSKPLNNNSMKKAVQFFAYIVMATGLFGMLFCLPFLFSSSIEDLVGAGFPFVGGAILLTGGLIALSNISNKHNTGKQGVIS